MLVSEPTGHRRREGVGRRNDVPNKQEVDCVSHFFQLPITKQWGRHCFRSKMKILDTQQVTKPNWNLSMQYPMEEKASLTQKISRAERRDFVGGVPITRPKLQLQSVNRQPGIQVDGQGTMAPEKRRRKRPKSDDNDDDDDYNEKIKAHDNDEGGQKQEDHEKEEEEEPPIRRSSRSRLAKTRRLLVDDQEDEDEQEELDNQRRENVEEMEGDDFHPIETDEEGGEDGMEKEDDYDEDHDKEKKKKSQSTKSGKKATTKKTKKKSDKVERRCPHCSKIFQHLKGLSYHVDNYVCRSEERPGGSAMKGKRKEHPEGSEGGASRKKYKRLRGKEKDRTCSRCNRVFTSVLGLTYHLGKHKTPIACCG